MTYVKGCEVTGSGPDEIDKAKKAAAHADVAVVVVGESSGWGQEKPSTDGEGRDSATLELMGRQEELVKAVQAAGKPTVVVLINGRPLAVAGSPSTCLPSLKPGCRAKREGRRWPKSSSATSIPAASSP